MPIKILFDSNKIFSLKKRKKEKNLELEVNSKGWFLNQNLREGRFNLERSSAKRATRVMSEPLVNTITVEIVVTRRQNLHFLAVSELAEADAALRFVPRAFLAVRRRVVEDYGQFLDGSWVHSLRLRERRRVGGCGGERGGGEASLVAANPARVDEENSDEENNGEEYDDKKQSPTSDLEVSVIEFRVVPTE